MNDVAPKRIAPPAKRARVRRGAPPALTPDCALFLDVDGTLVGDAPKPDDDPASTSFQSFGTVSKASTRRLMFLRC